MSFGEHTSKQIIGTKGDSLKGKKIVLCVTGSVAAIKSPEIARELMRFGAEVFTVMTPMAQKIIHPYMMEWSTGNPVVTELTGEIEHVTLGGEHDNRADLVLVAPSTANTIGKAAVAIDDTPVTTLLTTAIGARIPIIIAPAMHASMYKHPIVVENIGKLESIGVEVLMPRFEEEKAKIPGTEEIVDAVVRKLTTERDLEGLSIVVTGGPTREYIDGFRFISNPSSGKMGVAIAEVALSRGARVTLVHGPGTAVPPPGAKAVPVQGTEDMLEKVVEALKDGKQDVAILSAAAADYKASERKMIKTPSGLDQWNIELRPLPKVIEQVKKVDPGVFLVGFKAEYDVSDEELIERASKRMGEAEMDIVVANDVAREKVGFEEDTNEVFIIDREGEVIHTPIESKVKVAERLLDVVKEKLGR
ncbi:MAG: bifunctional phosphopantothenoylcysteine decarboxylase/phosphopantothenate--cysteine ligase CoaBC [Candidatus Bathyarchaeota archaeon]|nr:MAG: bifunctional phosphopantothenoylcysteine decarboxylase/phosphopantothenate--cysteine ligase CoaBC [Candidatus Bathyarchaeota archaeon]